MIKRNLTLSLLLLILLGAVLSVVPNLGVEEVSAVPASPYIMIIPEQTVDPTITVGMNYTISVYTDYSGSDVWGWQFGLTFDPAILQGLEVLNGDLITTAKNSRASFIAGTFDNSLGTLSTTAALFYQLPDPPPTTNGPGTLAYVKFRVVGRGISDLTLGTVAPIRATLQAFVAGTYPFIIDASQPPGATEPPYGVDHIGHGNFNNVRPGHHVAVTKVVAPASAILGDNIAVNVTVANEGSFTESFNLTVRANAHQVGNQTVTDLASGQRETRTFTWNTTDITAGNYVLNATAWLLTDMDMSDNNRTAAIEMRTLHDIAVVNLQTPSQGIIGDPIIIDVTVANQGTFEENVNLTITYQRNVPSKPPPTRMNTTIFQLAKRPTSNTISASWNTTGIAKGSYKINATVTITQDEEPNDNSQTVFIQLEGHDVAITDVSANSSVFIGEPVTVTVTVKNAGSFEETFDVTVTYGSSNILIGTQQVVSLAIENSATLSFTWDTTGVTASLYTINATVWLTTDVNLANNYLPDTVVVATPAGHIAGTVEDASTGEALEGVQISSGGYSDVTDANGHYNITNVPIGTYTVTASRSGFQTSSKTNVNVAARQTTNLDFNLTPVPTSGNIAGTVTDASTGNPVEGVNVTTSGYFDITDENGRYNITNVPAGTYTITASKDGYESSSNDNVVVTAGQTRALDFELTPTSPDNPIPPAVLYAAIIVIAVVAILGIALYLRKTRKAK